MVGTAPLFMAATSTCPELVQLLLDGGADPNTQARDGWTALMMTVRDGEYENTRMLLEAGANLFLGRDMFGRTALDLSNFIMAGHGMRRKDGETYGEALERSTRG